MSEADARTAPTRGRSSTRGGRGGLSRGGPRGGRKQVNGTSSDQLEDSLDEQGEIGEMKKKYSSELIMLRDIFQDWTDTDLVFALEESGGDLTATVDKITQGAVGQFAEVKKPKDRTRSKAPKDEPAAAGAASDRPPQSARVARGRGGLDAARGGRGRGSDRGRGGHRGGRGGHATTNGALKDSAAASSVPTAESTAWDTPATAEATGGWDDTPAEPVKETADSGGSYVVTADPVAPAPTAEAAASAVIPESGAKKTWASMFAKPKPAPVPVPQKQILTRPSPAELAASEKVTPAAVPVPVSAVLEPSSEEPAIPASSVAPPVIEPTAQEPEPVAQAAPNSAPVDRPTTSDREELMLTPSKDPLTEENVEHLPDESQPPATLTAASTAGSADPRNLTPLPAQQPPIGRPPVGGYATVANRLAAGGGRSASFQRRVLEQQEAVVMPGHNSVDRAAVQFGSMGLNGEPGPEVDDEREEAETRQAPQNSPPALPRTSLPPAPQQAIAQQQSSLPEVQQPAQPTPKQAPGLPPASAQNQQQIQDPSLGSLPQDAQGNQGYNQYGRYGQPGLQQDSGAPQQKPYDPFSHQAQPSHFDQFGHAQQHQQPHQSGFGGLSGAPSDYPSYYTSGDAPRNAYNQYYGSSFGPQDSRQPATTQTQAHDPTVGQQRSASGFGAANNDSAFAAQAQPQVSNLQFYALTEAYESCTDQAVKAILRQQIDEYAERIRIEQAKTFSFENVGPAQPSNVSRSQQQARNSGGHDGGTVSNTSNRTLQTQSRYAEAPGSGHNTPNPTVGNQQQPAQGSQSQSQAQQQHSIAAQQHAQQHGFSSAAAAAAAGFPYGHPYYNSPYQQAYQNQFGYSNQYGGGYGGGGYQSKQQGGMYGAPQGYGSAYDQHSSSPANTHAFSQNQQASMRSASGMGSSLGGLDDYGRGSAQSGSHQQSSGFGGINDPFARSASGFGTQGGYGQQSIGGQDDSLKAFDNSKSGPSPSLSQPGRPGSAANNSAAGSSQSGLPPPQSQHSGFGGYPGFPGQGSQYGGLGGLGSHQQGQGMGSQYGGYGGFNQTYGGYGQSRGGWGQNYGAH